jgi:hypothetical protein
MCVSLGVLVAGSIGAMMSRENPEQLRAYLSLTNMVLYNLELGVSIVKYPVRLFSRSL